MVLKIKNNDSNVFHAIMFLHLEMKFLFLSYGMNIKKVNKPMSSLLSNMVYPSAPFKES